MGLFINPVGSSRFYCKVEKIRKYQCFFILSTAAAAAAIVSTESVLIFAATESPLLGLCSMGLLSPLITIVVVLWVEAEDI